MKTKLSFREYVSVASMLFGMFFGAGNLIFPVALGQHAGSNVWLAFVGLFITGVGMPLLGVAALGISRSTGLFDLSSKAGRPYGMFFTCLLYLTIGPFFAIPRCATTSFTVGLEQISCPRTTGPGSICSCSLSCSLSLPSFSPFVQGRSSLGSAKSSTPPS